VATALRETEEEVGLARRHVEVIGQLPVYATVTSYVVTPVVGLVRPDFALTLDRFEVAEAFEVPLHFLMTPAHHRRHAFEMDGHLPLIEHLMELRTRLLWSIGAFAIAFGICYYFSRNLYGFLAAPLANALFEHGGGDRRMIFTALYEAFFTYLKVAFFGAVFFSFPMWATQLWLFVAPGLYRSEKRMALPLLLAAVLLFYLGVAFAYGVMLPAVFGFLTATVPEGVAMMTDINAYLSFVLVMGLASGLAFEMPIAVLVALLLGWVTPEQLAAWRGYIVVLIAILAALVTPPDGVSMLLLMIPMWLLFELGLLVGRLLLRGRERPADA